MKVTLKNAERQREKHLSTLRLPVYFSGLSVGSSAENQKALGCDVIIVLNRKKVSMKNFVLKKTVLQKQKTKIFPDKSVEPHYY